MVVRESYPHQEGLRGQVGVWTRDYGDGTVLVVFEDGPYKGDRVCMDRRYIEPMS